MPIADRLAELGLSLPAAPPPVGSYVPGVREGRLVYTSGQLPMVDGKLTCTGVIDAGRLDDATAAARMCVLNALGIVAAMAGSLDVVTRVVRLNCYVASKPDFFDQPKVANGASNLLTDIFGDAGKHSRCAIGAAALPLNASVELDLIVAVDG